MTLVYTGLSNRRSESYCTQSYPRHCIFHICPS